MVPRFSGSVRMTADSMWLVFSLSLVRRRRLALRLVGLLVLARLALICRGMGLRLARGMRRVWLRVVVRRMALARRWLTRRCLARRRLARVWLALVLRRVMRSLRP